MKELFWLLLGAGMIAATQYIAKRNPYVSLGQNAYSFATANTPFGQVDNTIGMSSDVRRINYQSRSKYLPD
ncbi:MAG: hypothetical protein FWE53_00155 [Firmicutes bacterium]|nr:hypothetical protein [Bacillota bacterium]